MFYYLKRRFTGDFFIVFANQKESITHYYM